MISEIKNNQSIRWWPAAAIAIITVIALITIWLFPDLSGQQRVFNSLVTSIIASVLFLLWVLLFSRLRLKMRVLVLGGVVVAVILFMSLFQLWGVTGDVLPILEWRWTPKAGEMAEFQAGIGPQGIDAESVTSPSLYHLDYPQFLGPNRNATVEGIKLARDWEAHPPREIWRRPVGEGWSGFSVLGDFAVTQEQRGEEEMVVCYGLFTGEMRWTHSDITGYKSAMTGDGPRATPTVHEGKVYTFGATGILNCLDLNTGDRIWFKNVFAENNARNLTWGASASPLVVDSLVVVCVGGSNDRSLVAYHKDSGEFIWGGGNNPAAYSSPFLATIAGDRQVVIFNMEGIVAHGPQDGNILWRQSWPSRSERIAQPVPLPGDRLLVSMGYGIGSKLYQIDKNDEGVFGVNLIWESRGLKAKFTNVVHMDGYIYGLDDGILVCLDLTDGKRKWKRGRYGHGQVILVDDLLLVLSEKGDVVLVEPSPESHMELGRFKALEGKTWNTPALAGKYLLVRNNREAACYELGVGE